MSALALLASAASILFSAWLFARVQEERASATREACQGTNDRQDETKAALDELISRLPPERRARAEQRQRGTVLLIEALAPKRDCERVVQRNVGSPPAR